MRLFARLAVFFDEFTPRDNDVVIFGVDFEDLTLDLSADKAADVAGLADIDLGSRQKDRHADIDQQAALDPTGDATLDHIAFFVVGDDKFPAANTVGLALAQQDQPAVGVRLFKQHLNLPAFLDVFGVVKFRRLDDTFALEAQFYDHVITELGNNTTAKDRAGDEVFDSLFQDLVEQLLIFRGEKGVDFVFQLLFRHAQLGDEITIYHTK